MIQTVLKSVIDGGMVTAIELTPGTYSPSKKASSPSNLSVDTTEVAEEIRQEVNRLKERIITMQTDYLETVMPLVEAGWRVKMDEDGQWKADVGIEQLFHPVHPLAPFAFPATLSDSDQEYENSCLVINGMAIAPPPSLDGHDEADQRLMARQMSLLAQSMFNAIRTSSIGRGEEILFEELGLFNFAIQKSNSSTITSIELVSLDQANPKPHHPHSKDLIKAFIMDKRDPVSILLF